MLGGPPVPVPGLAGALEAGTVVSGLPQSLSQNIIKTAVSSPIPYLGAAGTSLNRVMWTEVNRKWALQVAPHQPVLLPAHLVTRGSRGASR